MKQLFFCQTTKEKHMSLYVISTFRLVTILPVKSGIIVSELKELIAELDFEQ
nr:hypothetical protein [Escherichia albertii]